VRKGQQDSAIMEKIVMSVRARCMADARQFRAVWRAVCGVFGLCVAHSPMLKRGLDVAIQVLFQKEMYTSGCPTQTAAALAQVMRDKNIVINYDDTVADWAEKGLDLRREMTNSVYVFLRMKNKQWRKHQNLDPDYLFPVPPSGSTQYEKDSAAFVGSE
jgi:hypothetical protein